MATQSQYCTKEQLIAFALPAARAAEFDDATLTANLQAASSFADYHLTEQYVLPILQGDAELARMVAAIAAFNLYTLKGFNPNASVDRVIKERYDEAVEFFQKISKQLIHPDYVDSAGSTAQSPAAGVFVQSAPAIGWCADTDDTTTGWCWNWWK